MRKNSSALTLTSTTPDASSDSTSSSTRHKTDTAASSSPSGRNAEPPRDKSSKLAAVQVLAALVQQAKNEPYVQPKLREEVPTPFPSPSPALEAKDTRKVKRWRDAEGNKIVNEYVIIRTLGSGSYGKVKLCINTENNEFYALKICHKGILKRRRSGLSSALQDVLHEVAIMKKLRHQNIVQLYEVINDPDDYRLYIVMEYVSGGPIMRLSPGCRPLEESLSRSYFRDMIAGLEYLHKNRIIHRDIKPENLLVTEDGSVKISDFGVSHVFHGDDDTLKRSAGSPAFLSPELCTPNAKVSGKAADIYACGVTLYCMTFGKVPFMAASLADIYETIRTEGISFPTPIDPDLKDLLLKLLEKNPEKRIKMPEIKEHPWVTNRGELENIQQKTLRVNVTQNEVQNAVTSKLVMLIKLRSRMRTIGSQARTRLAEKAREIGGYAYASDTDTESDDSSSYSSSTSSHNHSHLQLPGIFSPPTPAPSGSEISTASLSSALHDRGLVEQPAPIDSLNDADDSATGNPRSGSFITTHLESMLPTTDFLLLNSSSRNRYKLLDSTAVKADSGPQPNSGVSSSSSSSSSSAASSSSSTGIGIISAPLPLIGTPSEKRSTTRDEKVRILSAEAVVGTDIIGNMQADAPILQPSITLSLDDSDHDEHEAEHEV